MQAAIERSHPRRRLFFLVLLSFFLAIWAQWALFTQKFIVDGIVLFTGALVVFGRSVLPYQRLVISAGPQQKVEDRQHLIGWTLAPLALFILLTFMFSSGNRFRPETVVFWLLSVVFYVRAFWSGRAISTCIVEKIRSISRDRISISWTFIGLVLVLAIAAFFRYYQIGAIPPEPTSDHAEKLLDIRDVLNGQYNIFFPHNTGREAIQFYVAVPFVHMFGLSHMALKVEQATVSLLAVPLVYLIGKEIGGSKFGLLAAFFLAVSKWDVEIARVGLRFPLYPVFVALAFYFLLRGLRRGSPNDLLLCGLATGLGMYGYSPFRAMALVIPALIAVKVAFDWGAGKPEVRRAVEHLALCAGAALVVFVPLGHYMTENPGMFWYRALTRVASVENPMPSKPFSVFLSNVTNALLMFNWRGDVVWVNSIPHDPVLGYVSGGLFLLGVAWCFHSLIRHREPVAAYLLVSIPILLLPSILSLSFPGENPSVVRTGGAGPLVALLVAAPLYLGARRVAESLGGMGGKVLAMAGVILVMLWSAQVSFERYFVDYPVQYRQSAVNSTEMAAVINGFAHSVGSRKAAYIKSYPYWVDTRNVAIEIGDPGWNNVLMTTEDILRHQPPPGNKLYIINKDDKEAVAAFQKRFPSGRLRTQPSATPGKEFLVFFVP